MRAGDLFWADLPASAGREQSGRRPVLVLQDDGFGGTLPTVLIIPLTSTLAARRFPGSVFIPASKPNGLTLDSVILTFQIRALDRTRLQSQLGVIEATILDQVYSALDRLTGHP